MLMLAQLTHGVDHATDLVGQASSIVTTTPRGLVRVQPGLNNPHFHPHPGQQGKRLTTRHRRRQRMLLVFLIPMMEMVSLPQLLLHRLLYHHFPTQTWHLISLLFPCRHCQRLTRHRYHPYIHRILISCVSPLLPKMKRALLLWKPLTSFQIHRLTENRHLVVLKKISCLRMSKGPVAHLLGVVALYWV